MVRNHLSCYDSDDDEDEVGEECPILQSSPRLTTNHLELDLMTNLG